MRCPCSRKRDFSRGLIEKLRQCRSFLDSNSKLECNLQGCAYWSGYQVEPEVVFFVRLCINKWKPWWYLLYWFIHLFAYVNSIEWSFDVDFDLIMILTFLRVFWNLRQTKPYLLYQAVSSWRFSFSPVQSPSFSTWCLTFKRIGHARRLSSLLMRPNSEQLSLRSSSIWLMVGPPTILVVLAPSYEPSGSYVYSISLRSVLIRIALLLFTYQ